MNAPRVTIGLSTYNRAADYLAEALGSAVAQTYRQVEIVVSDNHSTDETPRVVERLADDRVRYVRQPRNLGPNGNFNFCLGDARGDYFLLLHDDDALDSDMVATCMNALEGWDGSHLPGLIRTGTRVVEADGSLRSERPNRAEGGGMAEMIFDWFDRRTSLYLCSTLFHTDTLRAAGGFDPGNHLYQDVLAQARVAALRDTLDVEPVKASFRRHDDNRGTATAIDAWCRDSLHLLDAICSLAPDRADELRRRGLHYFSHNNYVRASRLPSARERVKAYAQVYRAFGYRRSPLTFLARRTVRRVKDMALGS